ncbi:glycoside hydrolase family 43 protein [Chengkuizengella marina]|nr:glycoside hydrolase family 43 protein [Chengkuizengella marina]
MEKMIKNPILKGFNPDPSIVRVGDDYYVATSTFEWFPGVQIHHSKDLINWRLLTRPLDRLSLLDMAGNPNSGGVWAPCLSYDGDLFYLVYTDVKSWHITSNVTKDTHNYVTTAKNIMGPWSEPIFLNSSGFDPSLFHDDDGKKWLVNMQNDFRKGKNPFAGILLQEFSLEEKKLVGPVKNIFKGTELGVTEAPHLYKRNGFYYLMTAEGGTSWDHAVSMARSKEIWGPYEVDPQNPMLTSAKNSELQLQKAGHASLVETQNGEYYITHLCGRPLRPEMKCNLGRETSIQKVNWTEDGWLRLEGGGNEPRLEVPAPNLPEFKFKRVRCRNDFENTELNIHLNTLRIPPDESWLSLKERPGYMRLRGQESLSSLHRQSIVARRQQAFRCEAETCIEFEPDTFQQMAGLVCYYDTNDYIYLRISFDEELGKTLTIHHMESGEIDEPLDEEIQIEGWVKVYLRVNIFNQSIEFSYSEDGVNWYKIDKVFEAGQLSDEHNKLGFTGSFIGICVQDLSGMKKHADFDYFTYFELDE